MALTICLECGGRVSTAAKACPHCGSKYYKGVNRMAEGAKTLVLAGLIGVAMVVAYVVFAVLYAISQVPVSP